MPNTLLLINSQIERIAILNDRLKERDDIIKLQRQEILHLQQDVSRLTSIVDAERNYREGSE